MCKGINPLSLYDWSDDEVSRMHQIRILQNRADLLTTNIRILLAGIGRGGGSRTGYGDSGGDAGRSGGDGGLHSGSSRLGRYTGGDREGYRTVGPVDGSEDRHVGRFNSSEDHTVRRLGGSKSSTVRRVGAIEERSGGEDLLTVG